MDILFHFVDQEQSKKKVSMISLKLKKLNIVSLNIAILPIDCTNLHMSLPYQSVLVKEIEIPVFV